MLRGLLEKTLPPPTHTQEKESQTRRTWTLDGTLKRSTGSGTHQCLLDGRGQQSKEEELIGLENAVSGMEQRLSALDP